MKQSELAMQIANKFLEAGIIQKDDAEVMAYYLENIMSMLIFIIPVTTVAICVDMLIESVMYLAAFFIGRACCGGYHAKTHTSCLMLSLGTYILFLCATKAYYQLGQPLLVVLLLVLISNILIIFYAPADSVNKRFSEKESFKYRKRSFVILVVQDFLFLLVLFELAQWIFFAVFFGIFQLAVSVWVVKTGDRSTKLKVNY